MTLAPDLDMAGEGLAPEADRLLLRSDGFADVLECPGGADPFDPETEVADAIERGLSEIQDEEARQADRRFAAAIGKRTVTAAEPASARDRRLDAIDQKMAHLLRAGRQRTPEYLEAMIEKATIVGSLLGRAE